MLYKVMNIGLSQQTANDMSELNESVSELSDLMKEMQGLSGILPGVLTFVGSFVVALFLEKAIDKKREQNIEKAKSLG